MKEEMTAGILGSSCGKELQVVSMTTEESREAIMMLTKDWC